MTLKKHFIRMFWETAMICGAMMLILIMYMQLNNVESVIRSTLWAIILLGSTMVFRAESLINFHNLEDYKMHINYLISSVMADGALLTLLFYFTPGGKYFHGKGWYMLIIYIVSKGLFYTVVYLISLGTAREINTKLKNRAESV